MIPNVSCSYVAYLSRRFAIRNPIAHADEGFEKSSRDLRLAANSSYIRCIGCRESVDVTFDLHSLFFLHTTLYSHIIQAFLIDRTISNWIVHIF